MNNTPITSHINPGNFVTTPPETLRRVGYRVMRQLKQHERRGAFYALLAGLSNLANQKINFGQAPRFTCNCCGYAGNLFIHKSNKLRIAWHSACPNCNSRGRHRGLTLLLSQMLATEPQLKHVLHVAPEPVLQPALTETVPNIVYQTTDLFLEDVDFPGEDLTDLSFTSGTYDLILCNHVLEHIEQDDLAIAEMSRVLAPGGVVVITVPGEWDRQETITFPDTSLNGHYRDYGLDFIQQLEAAFESVEAIDLRKFNVLENKLSLGIRNLELAFVCRK